MKKDQPPKFKKTKGNAEKGAVYLNYDLYMWLQKKAKNIKTISSTIVGAAVFCIVLQFSVTVSSAQAVNVAVRQEQPLAPKAVSRLLKKLKSGLPTFVRDKATVKAIGQKWRAQEHLVGKTRQQILDLLFQDVFSLVKDDQTLESIWKSWGGDKN